jgi:hypothetical protein
MSTQGMMGGFMSNQHHHSHQKQQHNQSNHSHHSQSGTPAVLYKSRSSRHSNGNGGDDTRDGRVSAAPDIHAFNMLSTKKNLVCVNGNTYAKLSVIGRGGSSKVFRVLGPDYNLYALKKVKVARSDPDSIESYFNEIALLRQLKVSSIFASLQILHPDPPFLYVLKIPTKWKHPFHPTINLPSSIFLLSFLSPLLTSKKSKTKFHPYYLGPS